MSKSFSGLFTNTSSVLKAKSDLAQLLTLEKARIRAAGLNRTLKGKEKKLLNTVCVAYDENSGKYYYGRNGGYKEDGYVKNPALFGPNGLLPSKSMNAFPVGNCAEVDAVNRALNAGARIENLHLTTIHTVKRKLGLYKESCENCIIAFQGKVKINYSGWIKNEK